MEKTPEQWNDPLTASSNQGATAQSRTGATRPPSLESLLKQHAQRQLDTMASQQSGPCKVCGAESRLFDVLDFGKSCATAAAHREGIVGIPVYYRRCLGCDFVFTEFFDDFTPSMWSGLVYNTAYYETIDPEYADVRPRANAQAIDALLRDRKADWIGLDYGGGNGLTSVHLSQRGYCYDTYDPFGTTAMRPEHAGHYNFCSAFEVAEHTPNPVAFLADIVRLCSAERLAILIGTHVHDKHVNAQNGLSWWYAAPRNGHISLHSRRSLATLARRFSLSAVSLTEQTHLLTRDYGHAEALRFLLKGKLRGRLQRLLRH